MGQKVTRPAWAGAVPDVSGEQQCTEHMDWFGMGSS